LVATFQPLAGGFRPGQDQPVNPWPAQMLVMEAPGSSQWMEPLEPELEAVTLNRNAGRAGSGGGLIRAPAPCPSGLGADVARGGCRYKVSAPATK
jgi:hypothetical protein